MSNTTPVDPQPRELEIIKVLFDRHLSNRAVALAESRWPGSGAMIRLAYDWDELSPEARREKISDIGPDDLARLKSLAALNPELEQIIDDLDNRGVLPHLEEAALAGVAATSAASSQQPAAQRQDLTFGAPIEQPAEELAEAPEPIDALPERDQSLEPEVETVVNPQIAERLQEVEEIVNEYDLEHFSFEDLKVAMPDLDSGLPSTSEVLAERETHRQAAVARADAAMERVRLQLDQTASRAFSLPVPPVSDAGVLPGLPDIPASPELDDISPVKLQSEAAKSERDKTRITVPPEWLVDAVTGSVVTTVTNDRPAPSSDELVALANQLDLELAEFFVEPGERRAVFGGLVRAGNAVDVSVGPLPMAMATGSLVVVHGRLPQKAINRLSDGYCDLPGTRATVRLHDSSRVVIIPE